MNISNEATVDNLCAQIVVEQKRILVLVNDAGRQSLLQHFRDADVTKRRRDFEVNVTGSFTISQLFVRLYSNPANASQVSQRLVLVNMPSLLAHCAWNTVRSPGKAPTG